MLDVPEVSVRFNPWRMLIGRLHMSEVIVDMKELVIVKDRDKNLNVDALKISQSGKDPPEEAEEGDVKKKDDTTKKERSRPAKTKRPRFAIDLLKLNLERVVIKDFSKGDDPIVTVHEIPLKDKEIRDIDSFEKLVTVLIVHAMGPTAIKSAGIYAAAAVLGVGFLPAGVLGVIVADDDAILDTSIGYEKAFDMCLEFIAERGKLRKQHREKGFLTAKIDGHDVRFDIKKGEKKSVQIKVTARKFLLPKPAYAGGIVYQLEQRLRPDR